MPTSAFVGDAVSYGLLRFQQDFLGVKFLAAFLVVTLCMWQLLRHRTHLFTRKHGKKKQVGNVFLPFYYHF